MYDEETKAMLRRIDQKFIDICIHNKYESRLEYIKAITEYIMDNRIDSGIVADCLDYLDIATDWWTKDDVIIYLINEKYKMSNEFRCVIKEWSPDLPF